MLGIEDGAGGVLNALPCRSGAGTLARPNLQLKVQAQMQATRHNQTEDSMSTQLCEAFKKKKKKKLPWNSIRQR